jgi:hypothetical protein
VILTVLEVTARAQDDMRAKQTVGSRNVQVKGLTFADGYGLDLLAGTRGKSERLEIIEYLSPSAKKVARIVSPPKAKKAATKSRSAKKK